MDRGILRGGFVLRSSTTDYDVCKPENICCVSIARTLHRRRDWTWWLRVTRPQTEGVTNRARVIAPCVLLPVIPCEEDLPEPVSLSDRKRPALSWFKQSRTKITQMQPWRASVHSELRSFGRIFSFFGFALGSVGSGCFPPSAAVKAGGEADARTRSVTATDVSVVVCRHQVLLESHTFGHQGETMITGAVLSTADWGVLLLSVVISWYKIDKSNRSNHHVKNISQWTQHPAQLMSVNAASCKNT